MQIELVPQQYELVYATEPWVLIHGGRGSSKTTGLCWAIVARAGSPGARVGLFRQTLVDLRSTTLKTLLEGDGDQPPVLMPGSYTHNQNKKSIQINGGGEIVYNGLDQGDVGRQMGSTGKGSSMNLSCAAFDEAVEMQEAAVMQICMSVRLKIDGMPLQRLFACNPGPPSHWIAKQWGLALDAQPMPGHRSIHANPTDNRFLPDEYIDELYNLEGVARERYLLGKWVGSDGLVYDRWDRNVHITESTATPSRVILGVDDGYSDPFVALRLEIDNDHRIHVSREVYETGLTQPEKIKRVQSIMDDADTVVVDSAAPELVQALKYANIPAISCKKGQGSIEYGINLVQSRLAIAGDDLPRLTIDQSCTKTITEFESYEWAKNLTGLKDKPIDLNNHAMDALRYGVRNIDEVGGAYMASEPAPVSVAALKENMMSYADMRGADPDFGFQE